MVKMETVVKNDFCLASNGLRLVLALLVLK